MWLEHIHTFSYVPGLCADFNLSVPGIYPGGFNFFFEVENKERDNSTLWDQPGIIV